MDYEKEIAIDAGALDLECLDQPMLLMKYSRIAADAEKEMDEAKERLDLTKAELDNSIRSNPEKFEIAKVTEAVVQTTILTQNKYKTAMAEYLQAKYDFKIISGAIRAIDHRKSMLEALVKLHGQQYFAGPKIPHDIVAENMKRQEQRRSDAKVKIGIKRTK